VGYTNVGKSTLFNLLTGSSVTAENKLFATLDPSQRRLFVPPTVTDGRSGRTVILSDTVGFIRRLPVELETAFRATLEELYDASLMLHVVDASDPDAVGKYRAVRKILEDMGLSDAPELVVHNKIDKASPESLHLLSQELPGVAVSAANKIGLGGLLSEIDKRALVSHVGAVQGVIRAD
jgi:GTP-binding protein HflX